MAGITFWLKYVLLCIFFSFCHLGWICSTIFLGIYIVLDLVHEELVDKKARKEILQKACLRRIDKIIKEERRNLSRDS